MLPVVLFLGFCYYLCVDVRCVRWCVFLIVCCYLVFVDYCLLCVVCGCYFVARFLSFVVFRKKGCMVVVEGVAVVVCCLCLIVVCCLLRDCCRSLYDVCCLLFVMCCLWRVVYCVLWCCCCCLLFGYWLLCVMGCMLFVVW